MKKRNQKNDIIAVHIIIVLIKQIENQITSDINLKADKHCRVIEQIKGNLKFCFN
jgi:hypothetical protein